MRLHRPAAGRLHIEEQLLLELSRSTVRDVEARRLAASPSLDARSFVTLAREHNLAPFVLDRLSRIDGLTGPGLELAAVSRPEMRAVMAANLALKREMLHVLAALRTCGIDAILLKGLSLDFGGLRTICDLDLLVPSAAILPAIDAILRIPAYRFRLRRDHHDLEGRLVSHPLTARDRERIAAQQEWNSEYQLYNSSRDVLVELHTRLLQAPPERYSTTWRDLAVLQADLSPFWNERVFDPSLDCHVLTGEHSLLLMCLHAAFKRSPSSHFRLSTVVDIDRLVERGVNWEIFVAAVRRYGVFHLVLFSLSLSRALLDTDVPLPVLGELQSGASWGRRLAVKTHLRAFRTLRRSSMLHVKLYIVLSGYLSARGVWERLRWCLLLPILFPSPHRMAEMLAMPQASPLLPFAYVIHPLRLIWRGLRCSGLRNRRERERR